MDIEDLGKTYDNKLIRFIIDLSHTKPNSQNLDCFTLPPSSFDIIW